MYSSHTRLIDVYYDNGFMDEKLTCELSDDGDGWCVMLKGQDFATTKLIGFGSTTVEAIADFRNNFYKFRGA